MPPILASRFNKTIMFVQTHFVDLILILFGMFQKVVDLGTHSKSSGRQNETKNLPSGAKGAKSI